MPLLSREQILNAQDRKTVEVDVPEWGGSVRLISFSADQALNHADLLKKVTSGNSGVNPLSAMLVKAVVDEHGKPIFTTADLEALGEKSPDVLLRLAQKVRELNKGDEDDDKEGESRAPEIQNGASPSDSPSH